MQMQQLINLYRQAEDYFFSGIALKYLKLSEGATAYLTEEAHLNYIYIVNNQGAIKDVLTKGEQFFKENNYSFELIVPRDECDFDLECLLKQRNYKQTGKSVSMMISLESILENEHAKHDRTTICSTDDKLNEWMLPLIGAFQTTEEVCLQYAEVHQKALDKKISLYHFSLYKDSNPISSITLSLHNKIARIDDVGTTPEFQKRGYATRLIQHVLFEAKKMGAQYCFLESSDSGFSIYQKIGFDVLFENNLYSKK